MADKERNMRTWNAIGRQTTEMCRDLQRRMLDYCKRKDKQKRDLLMMDLLWRIKKPFWLYDLPEGVLKKTGQR